MKKTIKQLKDSKNAALNTMQNLIDSAESEDRNLQQMNKRMHGMKQKKLLLI